MKNQGWLTLNETMYMKFDKGNKKGICFMKKIKVLHFQIEDGFGGIETFLLNLYKQIDRNVIQFEFITTSKHVVIEKELTKLGGIVHHISSCSNYFEYCRDIKEILLNDIDVVHVHKNSAANIMPLILSRKCGIKKIFIHAHNTAPSIQGVSNILHRINKTMINHYVTNKFACSTEAGNWLYCDNQFEVIKNGIILDHFRFRKEIRLKKRSELSIGENIKLIGVIGRFTLQKNQKRAVDIFECIHSLNSNTTMLLIGDGELKQNLEEYVIKKKLKENILFLGVRQDISELLMAMDVVLMPSLYEGLPIVAIEAQAAGLPIFLSDTISPEAAITEGASWFSLEDENDFIAKKINGTKKCDRIELNSQVSGNGYDMKITAMKLQDYYLA